MESYIVEWLSLLLRWTHFVVGIAWIGSSFYFVWLDTRLNRPPQNPENDRIAGDLWSVHGGGFYHAQKYQGAPARLPEPLHWFKWEAYTTWLTGFALLVVVFYLRADVYLVDPAVYDMSGGTAVVISLALLAAGWIVYDILCRTALSDKGIAAVAFVLLLGLSFALAQFFSGRGAYIQVGAMLGTIMAANVLFVIIPGQKRMVAAMVAGEEPDPQDGARGKQRSVHNNYMTLPVLFVMLSGHYPMTFGHEYNWLILIALFAIGATVRHYFNLRNAGRNVPAIPAVAAVATVLLAAAIAPQPPASRTPAVAPVAGQAGTMPVLSTVREVIDARCRTCHSATPTHPTAPIAPLGVMLDSEAELDKWAERIHELTVVTRTMPLANLTNITEEERAVIARWYAERAAD